MSKIFRMTAIAALAALAASVSMAETTTMDVTASVNGTCKLGTALPLDFGALDPATPIAITGKSTTISYLCTKGKAPATLTIGGKSSATGYTGSMAHKTSTDPLDVIPYSLSWGASPAGKGMGSGMEVTLTVNGTIAKDVYANVSVGDYSETLTIVFTP